MYTQWSKELQAAYEASVQSPLDVGFGLVTTQHGKNHTAAIHLSNYMKEGRMDKNIELLLACYLANDQLHTQTSNTNYTIETLQLAQLILDLEKDDVELTVSRIKPLTDEALIFALIHLWMNIIFLNGESEEPAHQYFIDQRTGHTENVLNFLYLYKLGDYVHPLIIELLEIVKRDTIHMRHRF